MYKCEISLQQIRVQTILDRSVKCFKLTSSRSKGSMVIPWVRSKVILTNLLADTNMSLADENASVMDRLSKSQFENLGLKTSLQKVLDFKTEDEIEFHLVFLKDSNADKSSQKSVT